MNIDSVGYFIFGQNNRGNYKIFLGLSIYDRAGVIVSCVTMTALGELGGGNGWSSPENVKSNKLKQCKMGFHCNMR